jgi:primosomal protein N' (replication factor Y) (superfamily II helicase)
VLGPVPDEQAAPSQGSPSQSSPSVDGPPQDHETESADTPVRALIRVPRAEGSALARALQSAQAARSPRKDAGVARVQLDPAELI